MTTEPVTVEQFNGAITLVKRGSEFVGFIYDRETDGATFVIDGGGRGDVTGTDLGREIERLASAAIVRAAEEAARHLGARQREVEDAWASRVAAIQDTAEARRLLADTLHLGDAEFAARWRSEILARFLDAGA